ncbi:MAG: two-component sensor histidine kinase [Moraxellaceae bacterium]|jgi:signal transduction histidine kinase|nr:two-component sensor histidine kinase [Moraxellaceae bacterium]
MIRTPGALLRYFLSLPRSTRREMLGPIQLGLLGYLAWLLGSGVVLWHAWQNPASQPLMVLLLVLVSGLLCLALSLYLLFRFLLPPARWHRDNRDWWMWLGLIAGAACTFGIGVFHQLTPIERFFQSFFLLNYAPLLARFRLTVALLVLLVETAALVVLEGGISGVFIGGCFALQGSVLLWLSNAVLRERHFREESELHIARLAGTRQLLEQAVAEAERARLARDLHDDMGHHLVALNLRLQLLERSTSLDEGRDHLAQARSLTGLLFTDLRNTVRDLREPTLDLHAAVEELTAHLPGIRVELDMTVAQGEVTMTEAECLLRCIQEAMTNALKHGQASRIRITLEHGDDGLLLKVRDNGRNNLPPAAMPGHGLQGLRERVDALAGRLWTERDQDGFVLYAHLPRENEA